jgi:hypothetical protein
MRKEASYSEDLIYHESLSSRRTQGLFFGLMVAFLLLFLWRLAAVSFDIAAGLLLFITAFFLFSVLNYRRLHIQLSAEALKLKFGIFSWTVPLENVAESRLDDMGAAMRMGGAGVHFMFIRGRYRALFNFLEYPRVVIAFKEKVGPVRDLSFSTQQPEELIRLIGEAIAG